MLPAWRVYISGCCTVVVLPVCTSVGVVREVLVTETCPGRGGEEVTLVD